MAFAAGVHAVVTGCLALALGYLVVDAVNRLLRWRLDVVALWGLAFPGTMVVITVLTLAHIATRGHLLSNPDLTRAILFGVAVVAVAVRWRRRGTDEGSRRQAW